MPIYQDTPLSETINTTPCLQFFESLLNIIYIPPINYLVMSSAIASPSNMMSSNLLPIQQAVQMTMQHHYNFKFAEVARAFMLKYNIENRFCFTTIASTRQLDEDRFEIVRRMENVMSSKPIYERIIFNRSTQTVTGFTFESENENIYTECYEYR